MVFPRDETACAGIIERLRRFADTTYLHQVIERRGTTLTHFPDLDVALDRSASPGGSEWRIHFHVPLFTSDYDGLDSTQDYVRQVLDLARQNHFARHFEIETYTWDVLPPGLKIDLLESIEREYRWVLEQSLQLQLELRGPEPARQLVASMHKTAVLNVVGLTPSLLGDAMPALTAWARSGTLARIKSAFPAVTCSAQSDYLTGRYPEQHGIVGNGWYAREDAEIRFWKQANRLVQGTEDLGHGASRAIRPSRARTCSGGSTCIRTRTIRSRHGRCIRPTAGRFPTSTRRRLRFATSSRRSSERFRCSSSGVRAPAFDRRNGSPTPPGSSIAGSIRR